MKNPFAHLIPLVLAITPILSGTVRAEKAINFNTTQSWTKSGGTGVYGWQFTARSNILVSALSLYDDWDIINGYLVYKNGLREQHTIAIWDVSNPASPLTSAVMPGGTGAPLVNGFRSVNIAPLALLAGHEYVIAATYNQGQDYTTGIINNPDFDLTVSPAIDFGGYRFGGGTNVIDFPQGYQSGVAYGFGPNFSFTVIPEARGTNMIYWQHDDGRVASWRFNGTNFQQATPLFRYFDSTSWRLIGVNDFNLDKEPEYLWHKSNESVLYSRWTALHQMEKLRLQWRGPLEHSWRLTGFGDFNGDTQKDMLWQNTNGLLEVWFMNGLEILGYSLMAGGPVSQGWRAMAVHDFNHDTHADILWQHDNGMVSVTTMDGTQPLESVAIRNSTPAGTGWRISGLSDFNNDGEKDILFRNKDGRLGVWLMQGTDYVRAVPLRQGSPRSAGWRIVGVQ